MNFEKIVFDLDRKDIVSKEETVFALGKFRSIHLGHQAILAKAKAIAEKEGKKLGFMIFDDKDSILSLEVRLELLSQYNPDYILIFKETAKNYMTSQQQFLE
jgi:riboflavin kinase/FMN adenylyltransferase